MAAYFQFVYEILQCQCISLNHSRKDRDEHDSYFCRVRHHYAAHKPWPDVDFGGWEYPVFLVVASIALWLLGDGVLTIYRSSRFALN